MCAFWYDGRKKDVPQVNLSMCLEDIDPSRNDSRRWSWGPSRDYVQMTGR